MTEDLFCDECGELIQGDVYYIRKTKPALVLHNPIFCSDDCVWDYLQVDSFPVEDFDEKVKWITQHGQDTMLFKCDQCNHTVSIDTLDVLVAEDHLHCPVCGAGPQHLFLIENDDKLEKQLAEIDPLLFINYRDFKPAQIFFNKKGDEYLIYDFIGGQAFLFNWCKYLEASQIDELKKLIIEYIDKRY